MRNAFFLLLTALCLTQCYKHGGKDGDTPPEAFHIDVMLKTTPVKSQGNSNFCWIYAMLATIESEHLMQGDSVNLSAVYVCRHALAEQARTRYAKKDGHKMTMRGMSTMTLKLLQRYGAMPYNSFRQPDKVDYKSLLSAMQQTADSHKAHLSGIEKLDKDITQQLETYLGFAPEWVFMLSCQYTPIEFAHSICQVGEYVGITSFTHHPFGSKVVLEVPDNLYQDDFLNVPLDSMMAYIDSAITTGHPVCWEGDATEPKFSFRKGVGRWDGKSTEATQRRRQLDFDSQKTTDDHCMAIVGMAHDKQGRKYYICKNSWGKKGPYRGFMFLSEDYVRMKTIAIVIPTAALPTADQMKNPHTELDESFPLLP